VVIGGEWGMIGGWIGTYSEAMPENSTAIIPMQSGATHGGGSPPITNHRL